MREFSKEISVAKTIARQAGKIILKYFRVENGATQKSDGSPVTIADKTINRMVIKELGRHFNDIVIGEEESTGGYGSGRRWICDPLDGTKAYVWGMPTAMFSLGLAIDGKPVLGVVYDPFLGNVYEAVKGGGSFCNGKPIRVTTKNITEGYISMTSSPRELLRDASISNYLLKKGAHLGAFSGGVYKTCLVAQGFFVGNIALRANAHDIIGGHIIVEEAGGKATGTDGGVLDYSKPFKGAVLSNGIVHNHLVEALKSGGL